MNKSGRRGIPGPKQLEQMRQHGIIVAHNRPSG